MDPLAEKYYSVSPYAYCNNNPIRFIDPTGMTLENPEKDRIQRIAAAAKTANEAGKNVANATVSVSASAYSVGGKVGVGDVKLEGKVEVVTITGKVSTDKASVSVSGVTAKGEASANGVASVRANMSILEGKASIDTNSKIETSLKPGSAGASVQIGKNDYANINDKWTVNVGAKLSVFKAEVSVNMKALGEWAVGVGNFIGNVLMPETPKIPQKKIDEWTR